MTQKTASLRSNIPAPPQPVEEPVALPRGPVFGWSALRGSSRAGVASVSDLPHVVRTTSGRAAIFHALRLLADGSNRRVLVPTYHCPTMVAPVLLAGMEPVFYPLGSDGLPDLDCLPADPRRVVAILVSHLFGRARSLAGVRTWCDRHGIGLIEDCAHCLFGVAGERPIGAWGDFATASLSKFLPVPEGGLLASARRPIPPLGLQQRDPWSELKGFADVAELSVAHDRLAGLNAAFGLLFGAKRVARAWGGAQHGNVGAETGHDPTMRECDMARIGLAPLAVTRLLDRWLPRGNVATARRRNFDAYARALADAPNVRLLAGVGAGRHGAGWPEAVAPYVFPLWVADADRVYTEVRQRRLPVFRWDRLWPGTPASPTDIGIDWSRHVLQLLCHQDLSERDVESTASQIAAIVGAR